MRLDAFFLADAASTPGDGKFYIHGGGLSRFVVPMLPFPLGVSAFLRVEVDDVDMRETHHFRLAVQGPVGPNIRPLDNKLVRTIPVPLIVEDIADEDLG